MMDFLAMGGYAVYVWPSYGLVALVLVVNLIVPIRRHRLLVRRLRRRVER